MKVLQLVKTSVGATWALEQMRELRRQGADVSVFLPAEGPMVEQYRDAGIDVHFADLDIVTTIRRGAAYRKALVGKVESLAPNVIHSHFVQTTLSSRLLFGRNHSIPRFFQIAGPLHLENRATRLLDVHSAGRSDYWVPACEMSKRLLLEAGIPSERVQLIYHGLRKDRFVAGRQGKLRSLLGVGAGIPIIGMVAYMYAPKTYLGQSRGIKGHEDLIDAVSLLPKQFDQSVLAVVGGPWGDAGRNYAERVMRYGKSRLGERVHFLGTRDDVLELYPDFSVAVHPSHSENLGGAVESMMMGVPTIATNVGGFPDIVVPGRTGWLAASRSPEELARAMAEVLSDPQAARTRAMAAKSYVSSLLDIAVQTRSLAQFYCDALSLRSQETMAA